MESSLIYPTCAVEPRSQAVMNYISIPSRSFAFRIFSSPMPAKLTSADPEVCPPHGNREETASSDSLIFKEHPFPSSRSWALDQTACLRRSVYCRYTIQVPPSLWPLPSPFGKSATMLLLLLCKVMVPE